MRQSNFSYCTLLRPKYCAATGAGAPARSAPSKANSPARRGAKEVIAVNPADEPRLRIVSSAPPSDASFWRGKVGAPPELPGPSCTNIRGWTFVQPAAPSAVPIALGSAPPNLGARASGHKTVERVPFRTIHLTRHARATPCSRLLGQHAPPQSCRRQQCAVSSCGDAGSDTSAGRSLAVEPPHALRLAALLLFLDPLLFRCPRGPGGPAALLDNQRSPDQLDQAGLRGFPVLLLAAARARDHSKPPLAVDARRQPRRDPRPALVVERSAAGDVPEQLDARARGVHVLATGAPSPGRAVCELRPRDRDLLGDLQHAVLAHRRNPSGDQSSSEMNCGRMPDSIPPTASGTLRDAS